MTAPNEHDDERLTPVEGEPEPEVQDDAPEPEHDDEAVTDESDDEEEYTMPTYEDDSCR